MPDPQKTGRALWPEAILALLWVHYFWTLVPSWRFGEYYHYGFLVPPLAFAFFKRRWDLVDRTNARPAMPGKRILTVTGVLAVIGLLFMIPLRIVETGDPGWRPPILLHGICMVALTHLLIGWRWGWKISGVFIPVTIFACSSMPYPWQMEQSLVRHLTSNVVHLTQEVYLLLGKPVELIGERLQLGQQVCEVTDGCSGIRSMQSLVMASLFFGELLWLSWPARIGLIAVGIGDAIVCNTLRAWYLSSVQFGKGLEAAQAAHDPAGNLAFAGAALILFLAAWLMMPRRRKGRLVVVRSRKEQESSVDP